MTYSLMEIYQIINNMELIYRIIKTGAEKDIGKTNYLNNSKYNRPLMFWRTYEKNNKCSQLWYQLIDQRQGGIGL